VIEIDDTETPVVAQNYVQGAIAGSGNGVSGGLIDGIIRSTGTAVATPRPPEPAPRTIATPAPPAPKAAPRITQLQMAEPIQRTAPAYPPIARTARIAGKVELMGVLGTDGRIHEVKVISGHPLLVKAAVEAVMQWVYRPTILNGQAVEVQAPIIVNFILN
jgi:protein TonB